MNINLIGSNGSLASAIGRYCNEQGHRLSVFGRSVPKKYHADSFHELDLMKDSLCQSILYDADAIIYAVGAGTQSQKHDAVESIYRLNVEVPILLHSHLYQDVCIRRDTIFISFGSYFEIGENSENRLFTEHDLLLSEKRVPNAYCISKRLITRYFSSAPCYVPFLHFILPTVYGVYCDNDNRLIPYLLRAIKNGEKLSFTSGEQIRQYLHVDEVPGIIEASVAKHIPSGIYNIAGNETMSVRQLVCMLLEAHGIQPNMDIFGTEKRQDEGMKILQLDGSKLNSLINHQFNHTVLSVLE